MLIYVDEMHRGGDTCWSYATRLHSVRDQAFHFVVDFPENNGRSEAWQLDVSIQKCTMLHIGCDAKTSTNYFHLYTLGAVQLFDTSETTDLGIIIDSKLRFGKHITSVVRKAHTRAALIKRCFKAKDHHLLLRHMSFFAPLFICLESTLSLWCR